VQFCFRLIVSDTDAAVGSWELVEGFFDASVSPERLAELINVWDEQIAAADSVRSMNLGSAFAHQVATAFQILEQLQAAELQRVNDLLSEIRTAAMVLSEVGHVMAANRAAHLAFGLERDGLIGSLPLEPIELQEFAELVAAVAASAGSREAVLRLRPKGLDRLLIVHLKPFLAGNGKTQVLAITSERPWPSKISDFLARVFALTPAEIEVMRLLTVGGTVAAIARSTDRSEGTVRSQLHSILEKTGTRTQAELLRLSLLLLDSVPFETGVRRTLSPPEEHQRFVRMTDGRRIEMLTFGDPGGRAVIWMQSTYGFYRLPRAAEADMRRRRLRVLVPFRAGYCGSDPPPKGRDNLEVAVEDLCTIMAQLRIASAPVVAPGDDIRIALMFAQAEPRRVCHIFGIGSGFPILNDTQYRRLIPPARFTRACARYTPKVLPFMIRGGVMTITRYGVERYLRGILARIPADARAFAEPEVGGALVEGVERLFFRENRSVAAVCAEMVLFHRDWPAELGQVACPVTLIHGEQDGTSPFETALEYCAMYPNWRFVGYPDEGELVAHVRWTDVLNLVEQALGSSLPGPARPGPLR
jgi:pimeloyl-ACP methyl ester carboxylesterase/DNA-binding CsgD family transcriptional regulator